MKTYEVKLTHTFLIESDDMEKTMTDYEFPAFKEKSEFLGGFNEWEETTDVISGCAL